MVGEAYQLNSKQCSQRAIAVEHLCSCVVEEKVKQVRKGNQIPVRVWFPNLLVKLIK